MTRRIPNYELYGEQLIGRAPDSIHIEPIRERSSKHDWVIQLHRHLHIVQVFLFRSTDVHLSVGDVEYITTCPTVLVVPPGEPHGFKFDDRVDGDVLSIRMDHASNTMRRRLAAFETPSNRIFTVSDTPRFPDIVDLFVQLNTAYHSLGSQRGAILKLLVELITLYLLEAQPNQMVPPQGATVNPQDRQDLRVQEFCLLLEKNFDKPWSVADYAALMNLSTSHLTRVCRAILGAPPNALVRQRRILEARRLLEYTSLSVSEVALRCGFRETAFFSRSFKSIVGVAPLAYRDKLTSDQSPRVAEMGRTVRHRDGETEGSLSIDRDDANKE